MRPLLLLLLAGTPSSPASDPAPAYNPADKDRDGVVTRKEARQQRRAERRARRRAQGLPEDGDDSDEALDAEEAAESSARGAAAAKNAAGAAAAMKNSMTSLDAAGGLPGGGTGASGTPGASAGGPTGSGGGFTGPGGGAGGDKTMGGGGTTPGVPGASGDPSNPKKPSDFVLAAHSGYSPAFAAAGLKLSADGKTVLRLDGSPATADDYARLQREISAMPGALGRRPDFFNAISPGHYADLKQGYKSGTGKDTVYKDVGTTEGDRDFVHTASCSKLSGDCNKSVEKSSYKRGDFVAPEDLDKMWDALQKELDGTAASEEESGMPGIGRTNSRVARESALDAARELAGELVEDKGGAAGSEGAAVSTSGTVATPVAMAAASVKKLWKTVALGLPGSDGRARSSAGLAILIGAAAVVLLGAGVLIARRKG